MTYTQAMAYVKSNKRITLDYDLKDYGNGRRQWRAMYFNPGLRFIATTGPTLEIAVAKLKNALEKKR